ncbi:DUF2116 family Zn-ribbon domain-containing protein [Candidatus Bathyarchaeota archaeon]|nr:DUF2116 family Zn-ribbon domain-containing protein [Candidatus Bathyarchaeota archaeon]
MPFWNKGKSREEKEAEIAILQKKQDVWNEKIAKGFQDHSHCIVCGRAIHFGKKYCSIECKEKYMNLEGKKGKQNKWMCMLMGVLLPLMMVLMFAFQ